MLAHILARMPLPMASTPTRVLTLHNVYVSETLFMAQNLLPVDIISDL